MKVVKSFNDIAYIVQNKLDIKQQVNGHLFNVQFVNLLRMPLIELLDLMNKQLLFYEVEQ